jgi:hypothetical protein
MKNIFKTKLKDFNKKYEKMPKPRKVILLSGIFVGFSVLMMGALIFPSLDKYKESSENYELLQKEKLAISKEKEEAVLKKAYKSEPSLLKQKKDLLVEIDKMLKNNKNGNYIAPEDVPKLIENIVKNINQVKVVSFRNIPNASSANTEENQSNVLVKHYFKVEVNGTFQGIYDVLSNLEKISGINISMVEIKKVNNGVDATFNFYVINTNKNILNF